MRCPREVSPFLTDILKVSVGFMKYDPNYSYDEDEEEEDADAGDVRMSEDNDGKQIKQIMVSNLCACGRICHASVDISTIK